MSIVITGGGTGGHLAIARAVCEELNRRGIKPIFIGSLRGQDRAWFENNEGFLCCYFFDTQGVVNQGFLGKAVSVLKIIRAMREIIQIYKAKSVQKVFSVGGFSAAPASFVALLTRKPLYIHEQNAIMGSLNRLLKPFAKAVFSSYLPDSPAKDYPVAATFFKYRRIRTEVRSVIFLGGSQGAAFINDFALNIAGELVQRGIKIIHQTGARDFERVKEAYQKKGIDAEVFDFDKNLAQRINRADFAISRAGASTLWELSANALPALFVPFPHAAGNHQFYNAKFLADLGLAFVKRQEELNTQDLWPILESDIQPISEGLANLVLPDGAKKIVDLILAD